MNIMDKRVEAANRVYHEVSVWNYYPDDREYRFENPDEAMKAAIIAADVVLAESEGG